MCVCVGSDVGVGRSRAARRETKRNPQIVRKKCTNGCSQRNDSVAASELAGARLESQFPGQEPRKRLMHRRWLKFRCDFRAPASIDELRPRRHAKTLHAGRCGARLTVTV